MLLGKWKLFKFEKQYYLLHTSFLHLFQISSRFYKNLKEKRPSSLNKVIKTERTIKKKFETINSDEPIRPKITAIALNVTQNCNLACKYCYAQGGTYGNPSVMNINTAQEVINYFINKFKPRHFIISFFGGEPLLNLSLIKDVVLYTQSIPKTKFIFKITTNATLLNKEVLNYLITNKFYINVSYDGEGIHNFFRVDKNFVGTENHVKEKLDLIHQNLLDSKYFSIRTTVNKTHLEQLYDALLQMLYNYNCKIYLSLNQSPYFNGYFEKQDILKYIKILEKVCLHCIANKKYHYIFKLTNIQNKIASLHLGLLGSTFCGAGINYISVSAKGNFYLCHRFTDNTDFYLGNYKEGLDIVKLKKFLEYRQNKPDICKKCYIREICGGGCFMDHYCYNKNPLSPHKNFCLYQKKEFNLALKIYLILQKIAPHILKKLELNSKE